MTWEVAKALLLDEGTGELNLLMEEKKAELYRVLKAIRDNEQRITNYYSVIDRLIEKED